jgi:hypothetical protein
MKGRTNHTLKKNDRQAVPLKVIELFAGVGGFRLGLDRASKKEATNTRL